METRTTQSRLDAITDDGLFERLATAVLREADPRWRTLAQSGVNLEGRTIRSPPDRIAFVPDAVPLHKSLPTRVFRCSGAP